MESLVASGFSRKDAGAHFRLKAEATGACRKRCLIVFVPLVPSWPS